MNSNSSVTNLLIISRGDRFKSFCKLYWRILVIFVTPLILLPVVFIKSNNTYTSFYVFLVMGVYWAADVLHPAAIAMTPIAISSIVGVVDRNFISEDSSWQFDCPSHFYFCMGKDLSTIEMYIRNDLIDCIGIMMIIIAIEHSGIHRRAALKVLLLFGCSHYRLSFILFFTTMFLSMWMSNTIACGFMMPLVKAILTELEKIGIIEIYQTIGKARQRSNRHELNVPRPSDFTVFYFIGIAYSSSIGDLASLMGSHSNQIFKIYFETIFPKGPKIEFPHFMLLNLPGVIVMEILLYTWLNFYFLGMFRNQSAMALQISMTEEEAQYVDTLLSTQYQQMGKFKFQEYAVASMVILTLILQLTVSAVRIDHKGDTRLHDHIVVSSPCIMCVILLFITPVSLDFVKFFKRPTDHSDPLPSSQTKSCLNWDLVNREIMWSVPFILAGSGALFESLRDSGMTVEFETLLLYFSHWPPIAIVLVVVVFCKILTEFADSAIVVYSLLPSIAKGSVLCDINPHFLMLAVTLGSSLSFHLVTGSAVNAMVCAYVHIPPWKMMCAGIGPSLIAILVVWFTVAVWSAAIWTDIHIDPEWADINMFMIVNKKT